MAGMGRIPGMAGGADGARAGGASMAGFKGPKNIQFMLTRMTAYSKNTIR